jgi:hypothetical protein
MTLVSSYFVEVVGELEPSRFLGSFRLSLGVPHGNSDKP